MELNAAESYRLIKDYADLLYAFMRSTPSCAIFRAEGRLDWEVRFFRRHFDRGNLFKIKPPFSGLRSFAHATRTHDSLPHASIVAEAI